MANQINLTQNDVLRRNSLIAALASECGIDSLVILDPSNVYFTSGFRTMLHTRFTAVVFRTENPNAASLVVPSVDQKMAKEEIWFPCRLSNTDVYFEGASKESGLPGSPEPLLSKVIQDNDKIGVDLENASWGQVEFLRSTFPNATFVDISDFLHDARRIKSVAEIELMRRANHIASEIVSQIPSMLEIGLSESQLSGNLNSLARESGSDGFAYPTLIGFGPKSLAPHAPPTDRRLEANQIVTVAFGPMISGYCADIVQTFYFGEPSDEVIERAQQSTRVHVAALGAVKAGVEAGEIMKAAHGMIRSQFPDLPLSGRAGHSLGLTVHETPSLTPDNRTILQENMILAVEPSAAPFAMDGIGLFRQCSVVLVTSDGYELLTSAVLGLVTVSADS